MNIKTANFYDEYNFIIILRLSIFLGCYDLKRRLSKFGSRLLGCMLGMSIV